MCAVRGKLVDVDIGNHVHRLVSISHTDLWVDPSGEATPYPQSSTQSRCEIKNRANPEMQIRITHVVVKSNLHPHLKAPAVG